jgi:hypothetical protein
MPQARRRNEGTAVIEVKAGVAVNNGMHNGEGAAEV